MDTGIFYITNNGLELAKRLKGLYPDAALSKFKAKKVSELWGEGKTFIFIMATGIVVRTIAPLIKDKRIDPAVVVLDEKGEYAISLLSGHLGGANRLAKEIANFLGARPVITTASDGDHIKNLIVGIGCNSGTSGIEIEEAVRKTLAENNLSFLSIHSIATIDKKGSEPGLNAFARRYGFGINTFTPDDYHKSQRYA
ncbi:cobalamin biosynthesis protein [bacterium]|nr:cobalamin biosynthesis protein [bacterium]MBU1614340.1 cobalamin biosynthesis protein [bacterium]MBU2634834.1 cobalamin biosynthesis protein [Nanoarchaeota archaeon]